MRSGGISLFSLTAPVLALSMLMSMLCAWINLDIAPYCRSTYKQLIRSVDVGRLTDLLQPGVPMTDIPDQFIQIEERKEVGEMVLLRGIRYVKFEKDIPVYDILAEGGTLEANESNNQLFLSMTNCTVFQRYLSDSKDFEPGKSELDESNWFLTKMPEYSPSIFTIDRDSTVFRKPKLHHMSFRQLQQEMKERQELADDLRALPSFDVENMRTELAANVRKPFDPITPVKVQMHRQIAFSYACFAFTLIGIPLGIRAHRRETSIGIAIALMLVAVYYGFVVLANALENHGEWAPHLIMWFPNFLFQAVGCVLFWRANKGM